MSRVEVFKLRQQCYITAKNGHKLCELHKHFCLFHFSLLLESEQTSPVGRYTLRSSDPSPPTLPLPAFPTHPPPSLCLCLFFCNGIL